MSELKRYTNVTPDTYVDEPFQEEVVSDHAILKSLLIAQGTGKVISGVVDKATPEGDMMIRFSEKIKGVVPRNNITFKVEADGNVHKGVAMNKVGRQVQFKVVSIEDKGNGEHLAILDRKEVVKEIHEKYQSELKPGMIVQGVVIGIQDYGAFIDIGGDVTGLLAVGDVTRVYIKHPSEKIRMDQKLDVVVRSVKETAKGLELFFDRTQLLPGWESIDEKFQRGETVLGTVKTIIDTGVFVELNDSFEGLAEFVPGRKVKYGDRVRVKIEGIHKDKKRIKLRFI